LKQLVHKANPHETHKKHASEKTITAFEILGMAASAERLCRETLAADVKANHTSQ